MTEVTKDKGIDHGRRKLLKTTAGAAVAGSFISGAPYVMSQEKKVLRYLGTAVNQSAEMPQRQKKIWVLPLSTFRLLLTR